MTPIKIILENILSQNNLLSPPDIKYSIKNKKQKQVAWYRFLWYLKLVTITKLVAAHEFAIISLNS